MKTYKAHLCQAGEGCDYTIGCGHALIWLKASNMEEAKIELAKEIKERYSSLESEIESAVIFEVTEEVEINVKDYYDQLQKERDEYDRLQREKREREEFERLKQKFGN